jgi:hypothetical protein
MHNGISFTRRILPHELNKLIVLRMGATEWSPGFLIFHNCLLGFDSCEGIAVTLVEVCSFSEGGEADIIRVYGV